MHWSKNLLFSAGLFFNIGSHAGAESNSRLLAENKVGYFNIGMSIDEVNNRLHEKIVPHEIATRATANCDYNIVPEMAGVALVFIDEKLMRIDVTEPNWVYGRGVVIGMKKREFLRRVHNAKKEPLDFNPAGSSYVVSSKNSKNAISFQFENDGLTRIIVGDKKVIRYAEVCM